MSAIHREFGDIKIEVHPDDEHEWLITTEEVARAYGVDETTIRRHKERNRELARGVHWFRAREKLPFVRGNKTVWTKAGFIALGNYVKTSRATQLLQSIGVVSRHNSRIEHDCLDIVTAAISGFTRAVPQYEVRTSNGLLYKADLCLPELKLVVEIDEWGHENYSGYREQLREEEIVAATGFDVFRHNPHDQEANIGHIINAIFTRLIATRYSVNQVPKEEMDGDHITRASSGHE